MGKGYRQGRLGEEIRRILSEMLINGIKDPRLAGKILSVSGVSVTRDGSYATCYLSLLADTQDAEARSRLRTRCSQDWRAPRASSKRKYPNK